MIKVPEIFQIKHNRLVPESTLGDLFSIVFVVCAPQMPSKVEGILKYLFLRLVCVNS